MGSSNGSISQETIRKMEKGIGELLKLSREQHFTVVLLANAYSNAYVSCSSILKLPPLYHTTFLLLLIKNLTSCTSRDTNFSKTVQRTAMRAPTRTQEPEDSAPYNIPCQQEAAKETKKLTNFPEELLRKPTKTSLTDLLHSPLIAWLLPLLGPIFVLIAFCTLLPCLLKFLQTQVNKFSNQTFNKLLLQG
jgi:hypothetical protein